MHITNKPLAAKGFISYRYQGVFGWIMIGAKNDSDALNNANRSLSIGKATLDKLQKYEKFKYFDVTYLNDKNRVRILWVCIADVWFKYNQGSIQKLSKIRQKLIFTHSIVGWII